MRAGEQLGRRQDDPDQYVPFAKRSKVRLWQLLPIKPLL